MMSPLRAALRTPETAWPTLLLGVSAVAVHVAVVALAATSAIPIAVAGVIAFICAYVSFTPMHDAAHRSVSRHRLVNEWIGRLASFSLAAPFAAFRYVHLEHHRHTNDAELDPDHYAGRGPKWSLPLRWLTQDLHYYVVVFRNWRSRPKAERLEVVVHALAVIGTIALLTALGYGEIVLYAWLLPARLAIGALAFAFDYLPHVPHQVPAKEDRYAATRMIEGPGLTALFLFQNYHLIHHLYPGVPFYRYKLVLDLCADDLAAKGAQTLRILKAR